MGRESSPNYGIDQNRKYEELRLLYQVSVADIAFFKTQQWNVTNYGLLLYAAIFGITHTENVTPWERAALCFLLAALMCFGLFILSGLEKSIAERRRRLDATAVFFGNEFRCIRPTPIAQEKSEISWLLKCVLVGGAAVVAWFVLRPIFLSSFCW